MLSTCIIIPTYLRPNLLINCLTSVLRSEMLPSRILVSVKNDDLNTQNALVEFISKQQEANIISKIDIEDGGYLPPILKALEYVKEDITIILDDDTEVKPDWLKELILPFNDSKVGAVGGQVFSPNIPAPILKGKPGTINWYGKFYGNVGWVKSNTLLEVDTIMEGNSAWRTVILKSISLPLFFFDDVSPFYGLYLTLHIKKLGYKIIYNSKAYVDHFNGIRAPNLERDIQRSYYRIRNFHLISLMFFNKRKLFFSRTFGFVVGSNISPGLLILVLNLLKNDRFIKSKINLKIKALRDAKVLYNNIMNNG